MKFAEALEIMKKGIPMKLPSWGGYWYWDSGHISQRCESRNAVSSCGSASGSSVTSRRDVRAEIF